MKRKGLKVLKASYLPFEIGALSVHLTAGKERQSFPSGPSPQYPTSRETPKLRSLTQHDGYGSLMGGVPVQVLVGRQDPGCHHAPLAILVTLKALLKNVAISLYKSRKQSCYIPIGSN